ncbi:MAG: peptidoglycan DD-metalloendopeptidase family protein [Hyphomonadaceae bacterium]
MAVKQLKAKTKAFFEKAFPERQIYHRSGGSVRYVSISPWRQAMIAGAATLVVGWCLFATVAVLLRGPGMDSGGGSLDKQSARLERELRQARAAEQTALTLLETRTQDFNLAITEAKSRHETLKKLLASLQGGDTASAIVLNGANATMLIDSTIEEGDPRQSRPDWSANDDRDGAFRAPTDKLIGEQAQLLDSFEEEAVQRSETARGVIRLTGVPASRVLEQSGVGGPLVQVSYSAKGVPLDEIADPFERRIYEVEARLYEAQLYEKALRSIPLGIPVKGPYRETSGFGYRTDPFGRGTAFHEGTDLAAPTGSPLVATAPGKIVYAGVKGSFGRCVEIDHGGGFRTRYGHMNSISVRVGDTVALGQKVGTMGSTGRSTGPHLHYEIYFRGKSYDPLKFLRAGKHVY